MSISFDPDDRVEVKLGDDFWHPGAVTEVCGPGCVKVRLDDPLPTLDDVGRSHRYVSGDTQIGRFTIVNTSVNHFPASEIIRSE